MASSTNNKIRWLWTLACITVLGLFCHPVAADPASCPSCSDADNVLKYCNSSLGMANWPGTYTYQPSSVQAPCACNDNFYNLTENCLSCQSSSSAKLSVAPLAQYKLVCLQAGVSDWTAIYIPNRPTTTTTAPTETSAPEPDNNNPGSKHGLASGAIAGIVVSAVALIVALAVAGYVYTRRKREIAKQREDDELYKYQDANRNSYMEAQLPQYSGIQSSLPSLPQLTNLRVMNPDNDDDEDINNGGNRGFKFDQPRTSSPSPGWRRGSFDDD